MKRTIQTLAGMSLCVFASSRLRNRARYLLTLVLVLSLTALPLLPSPHVTRAFALSPVPHSQAVQQPDAQNSRSINALDLAALRVLAARIDVVHPEGKTSWIRLAIEVVNIVLPDKNWVPSIGWWFH